MEKIDKNGGGLGDLIDKIKNIITSIIGLGGKKGGEPGEDEKIKLLKPS